MGDLLNSEVFKKLGFDNSNSWILYDEQFQDFFKFLAENITDANILTEQELLERDELVKNGLWLNEEERQLQLQQIESENPGLLTYTPKDVSALTAEIVIIEKATHEYKDLIESMRNTKHNSINKLCELECEVSALSNAEKEILSECQQRAKLLEELQRENCKLNAEAKKGFTNQLHPLFMHQLSLEQYFLKCDSFLQYFTLYMKNTFKIQDYAEFETLDDDVQQINSKLQSLQESIEYYMIALIKERSKVKATQALIDSIDINQIHCISLVDMIRETNELKLLNDHHLTNTYDTLLNALTMHVQQHTRQRIELVLFENTKQKLQRALERHEKDKHLTKIISDALSNAELVWIAIQLDLEKTRNWSDNTERLYDQAQASWQRIQTMRSLNATQHGNYAPFLNEVAKELSTYQGQIVRPEAKSCLYEYEKCRRLLSYALQTLLSKNTYTVAQDQLTELKSLEETLRPFIQDSPIEQPMLEYIQHLCPILNASKEQKRIEEMLRNLRTEFQEKIIERMDRDKLWRYSQLLWIWFLTEPKRVLNAIEEAKKASIKVPAITGIMLRPGSGLQRK